MAFIRSGFCALSIVMGGAQAAMADDGQAAFENGALVFGKSATITMKEETLTVSRSLITADFQFVNTGTRPETITVAFPLPDMNAADAEGYYIPVEDNDNFVGFTTVVDGKAVTHGLEQRAFAPDGHEITNLLKAQEIPLVRPYDTYLDLLGALPKKRQKALIKAGAAAGKPNDISPQWVTKSKFYFQQTFLPGKPVHIVHSYKPSLDTSNMSFYSGDMAPSEEQIKLFCLNDGVKAKVQALEKTKTGDYAYAAQFSLSYVLSTAKTWAGPIGTFHLIIDAEKPGVVTSMCGDAKPTSPTRFEFTAKDYVPDRDLNIVMFE